MSRDQKVRVVEAYLESFLSKDLSAVSLAENVTFEGPRMPRLQGRQAVLGFLQRIMLPAVKDIRVKQHVVEGDYVATVFDMETTEGVLHVFDLIHVLDGEIASVSAFFYPTASPG
jgi:ketosteroid isomerase-like protein